MDYQVIWTESAQDDLKQVVSFIAADDPVAAQRFGLGLVNHIEQASQQPWSGRKVPEANIEALRELIYSPYRIIYEIMDEEKTLYVSVFGTRPEESRKSTSFASPWPGKARVNARRSPLFPVSR